jgi:hypothetical protein
MGKLVGGSDLETRFSIAAQLGLIALALIAGASQAHAETRRIAVVVGSNRGAPSHAPLRFAEQDASKFAAVLAELGGLAQPDILLLRGPTPAEVRAALDEAARRTARWHAQHRGQVVLMFYFSGHSDGTMLEMGNQGLPFAEVRRRVDDVGADVRLVILDSCRSGALLALKSGTLGESFDIRMTDDLASTGEAMITSSAADEAALESAEIGGAFFSHHLISGLRGAADLSGDGVVTLAEAYQYAFVRTLRSTSETTVGPQHPAYDYRLSGRGELVLTQLQKPSAVLDLPVGFDRLLLVAVPREQVLAELGPRSGHRIAVPSGTYKLRAWKGTQTFAARVAVAGGQTLQVAAAELIPVHAEPAVGKGGADVDVTAVSAPPAGQEQDQRPWSLAVGLGLMEGVAKDALLEGVDLGVQRRFGAKRVDVVLRAGSGRAPGMRENRVTGEVMPSLWAGLGRFGAGLGIGLGAGTAIEQVDGRQIHWSGLAFASPTVLVGFRLDRDFALQASADIPITLLRRNDRMTVTAVGALWLGLSRGF